MSAEGFPVLDSLKRSPTEGREEGRMNNPRKQMGEAQPSLLLAMRSLGLTWELKAIA